MGAAMKTSSLGKRNYGDNDMKSGDEIFLSMCNGSWHLKRIRNLRNLSDGCIVAAQDYSTTALGDYSTLRLGLLHRHFITSNEIRSFNYYLSSRLRNKVFWKIDFQLLILQTETPARYFPSGNRTPFDGCLINNDYYATATTSPSETSFMKSGKIFSRNIPFCHLNSLLDCVDADGDQTDWSEPPIQQWRPHYAYAYSERRYQDQTANSSIFTSTCWRIYAKYLEACYIGDGEGLICATMRGKREGKSKINKVTESKQFQYTMNQYSGWEAQGVQKSCLYHCPKRVDRANVTQESVTTNRLHMLAGDEFALCISHTNTDCKQICGSTKIDTENMLSPSSQRSVSRMCQMLDKARRRSADSTSFAGEMLNFAGHEIKEFQHFEGDIFELALPHYHDHASRDQ